MFPVEVAYRIVSTKLITSYKTTNIKDTMMTVQGHHGLHTEVFDWRRQSLAVLEGCQLSPTAFVKKDSLDFYGPKPPIESAVAALVDPPLVGTVAARSQCSSVWFHLAPRLNHHDHFTSLVEQQKSQLPVVASEQIRSKPP